MRRCRWVAMGVAVVAVTAACGGGDGVKDEVGVVRPPAVGPTTTTPPAATDATRPSGESAPPEAGPPTSAPARVTATTVARPEPVLRDGVPQVKVTPSRATAGTRIELDGYGFTGEPWQSPETGHVWLSSVDPLGDCHVMAQPEHDLRVSSDGHLTGGFVVPGTGFCQFTMEDRWVSTGGLRFDIDYHQCTDCTIGSFEVILPGESTEEPTGEECDQTVNFGLGENMAGDIYADGLSCEEAASFIRDHGAPLGPINGAAHIEAEGFSCDRTGVSDVHLPRANYKCVRGSQTIRFIRT